MLTCLLTTTFPGRSVHSPVKYVFFTVAYNIRPKFGRTFGTRSVSLTKPSASAECYSPTFGPSLLHTDNVRSVCSQLDHSWFVIIAFVTSADLNMVFYHLRRRISVLFQFFCVMCILMLIQESLDTRFVNLSSDAMDFMKVCQHS